MSHCDRARALHGPLWDDEISKAERDWLERHFERCEMCRHDYEAFARSLEMVATLPRAEASPDLLDRVLARTRHAAPAPDVVRSPVSPVAVRWVPAAAAGLLVIAAFAISPLITSHPGTPTPTVATRIDAPDVPEPVAVAIPTASPAPSTALGVRPVGRDPAVPASARALAAAVTDSLFDHAQDVEFVLDPVLLRRGRAHKSTRLAQGLQSDQAVISF